MKLNKAYGAHARIRMKQDAGGNRTVIADMDADKVIEMLGDDPTFSDDAEGFCILSTDGRHRFEAGCLDEADVKALQLKDGAQPAHGKRARRNGR